MNWLKLYWWMIKIRIGKMRGVRELKVQTEYPTYFTPEEIRWLENRTGCRIYEQGHEDELLCSTKIDLQEVGNKRTISEKSFPIYSDDDKPEW